MKRTTTENYYSALELIEKNVPPKTICELCGIPDSMRTRVIQMLNAAKRKDWKTVKNYKNTNPSAVAAVLKYLNVEIPDSKPTAEEPATHPAPDNTAIYLSQMLAEVKDLNENIRCLIDADLPKRFNDLFAIINAFSSEMVRTINANADVIEGDLKQQTQFLDNIRFNTKKLK